MLKTLCRAAAMHQHQHPKELFVPGTQVDIWVQPPKSTQDGWRGPAELLSAERRAGSAIVNHQGKPKLVPLRYIRKHIMHMYFNHLLCSSGHYESPRYFQDVLCNQRLCSYIASVDIIKPEVADSWRDRLHA